MYYESGIFPILFTTETDIPTPSTDPGPVANGELPPPPEDPPKG